MPRQSLYAGLALLSFFLTSHRIVASDTPGNSVDATVNRTAPLSSSSSQPVPAQSSGDASDHNKFYTLTASLREEYDDNIYTSKTNTQSSFKTDFSPSILVDFPMENSDFSARYTFGLTYYSDRAGDSMDYTDEFDASYKHSFSERVNLTVAELFRYYTEPSLFQSTGTPYVSGAYISNTVHADLSDQWTPLVSTLTSYSNTIIKYQNSSIGDQQNNMENTGSQTIGFAILPKITLTFGGIVDDISYDDISRGYTSYTGTTGASWQALPSLSISGSVGGSVTDTDQSGTSASPYGALSVGWQLGAASSFNFSYSHSVVPTDLVTAEGQIADRFNLGFSHDIFHNLTAHTQGIFTHGQYTNALTISSSTPNFTENDYAIDSGLTYHVNNYFDVDLGYTYSGISSGLSFRDYSRNQAYIGVRGTY